MMASQTLSSLLLLALPLSCLALTKIINTGQGRIRGVEMKARNSVEFEGFYGVPYAQPPVGEYRFQAPRPAVPWNTGDSDLLHATYNRSECLNTPPHMEPKVVGSEDCLTVNVFTRHPGEPEAKRPVLVWFHGGAFIFGGATIYNPSYIMEEDVVLVVVQYRLNIFGFLSTEDANASGNYGMLDQVEALRWIQKYISAYGGDPSNVGIFGMSAGGASVHYHMLSPMSRGLFKRAISLSGSSLNWWANVPNPRKQAMKLAEKFNCDQEHTASTVDCLRNVDAMELAEAHNDFFDWRVNGPEKEPMNVFSPRSDPEAIDPFLPEEPVVAMKKGLIHPVPYLLGYAEKEGIWRANQLLPDVPNSKIWADYMDNFSSVTKLANGLFGDQLDPEQADAIREKVVDFYRLKNLPADQDKLTDEDVHNFIDMLSDSMFTHGIDLTAKLHAEKAKGETYFFYLTYPAEHTLGNFRSDGSVARPESEPLRLATHGTDMLMMFPMFPEFDAMPAQDVAVSRDFVKMVVDFLADEHQPVSKPDWKPLNMADPVYLQIDKEKTVHKGMPLQERIQFWSGLDVYWKYDKKARAKAEAKTEL